MFAGKINGPPDSAVYVMQRGSASDRRGRIFVDAQDGRGLRLIQMRASHGSPEMAVFDWGRQGNLDRCIITAYAILCHVLEDAEWADQLKVPFARFVICRMADEGGRFIAGTVRKYITAIEAGAEAVR